MEGKFPTNDDFQIDAITFEFIADGDLNKWNTRIDKYFKDNQKEGDYARIVRFISLFGGQKNKVTDYYSKLAFDKMDAPSIISLVFASYDNLKDGELARTTLSKLPPAKITDEQRMNQIWPQLIHRADVKTIEEFTATFADREKGKWQLVWFYWWKNENTKGLGLIDELVNNPTYAKEAMYLKGQMLQRTGKYELAINVYRQADNPPQNLWRISECHMSMGKPDSAIAQLREIENFFKDQAARASLRIAQVYKETNQKDRYIASLRGVLAKYPESPESSTAHLELESMGIHKLGGGKDAQ